MADISKIQLSDNTQYNLKDTQTRSALSLNDESTGDISKIRLSDNTEYNIKDEPAREAIETITTDVKTQVNADKDLINNGNDFIDDETLDEYSDKIEEMQEAYKKFIPIQTTSGTEITIDNSSNDKAIVDIGLDGNTEQTTYEGKNLFNYNNDFDSSYYTSSYNSTTNELKIVSNGATTGTNMFVRLKIDDTLLTNGQQYHISGTNVSGVVNDLKLQLRNHDGTFVNGQSQAETITYNSSYSLFVVSNIFGTGSTPVTQGQTAIVKNILVEKGSSATSYEPFVGRNCLTKSKLSARNKSSYWRKYNKCSREKFV